MLHCWSSCSKKEVLWKHQNKFFSNILTLNVINSIVGIYAFFHSCNRDIIRLLHDVFLLEKLFTLFSTILERSLILTHPVLYQQVATVHILMLLAATWILAIAICSVIVIKSSSSITMTTVIIGMFVIILPLSQLTLHVVGKRYGVTDMNVSGIHSRTANYAAYSIMSNISLTYSVITISSTLFLLPSFIVHMLLLTDGKDKDRYTNAIGPVELVAHLNGLFDPFILLFVRSDIKKELSRTKECDSVRFNIYGNVTRRQSGMMKRYQPNELT